MKRLPSPVEARFLSALSRERLTRFARVAGGYGGSAGVPEMNARTNCRKNGWAFHLAGHWGLTERGEIALGLSLRAAFFYAQPFDTIWQTLLIRRAAYK